MDEHVVLNEILEPLVNSQRGEFEGYIRKKFSEGKTLYDFQVEALLYAMAGIKKFFVDLDGRNDIAGAKERMWELYKDKMGEGAKVLHYDFGQLKDPVFADIVLEYMGIEEGNIEKDGKRKILPFKFFSNRMSFWMATGSGKTLVIVSLIDVLFRLMANRIIPERNVLFLTVRDDLISQFKNHMEEFQNYHGVAFDLVSLKEFGRVKQGGFGFKYPVFYYRADNINDRRGDKIIDFRDYDGGGEWYVILDEAHKGDKESSKRQYIYSILARNGFLFNFSATFDDPKDIVTTAYEYNLSTFIKNGHGKHIFVFDENVPIKGGRKGEKFDEDRKKKIVLKKLILLAALRKYYEEEILPNVDERVYHMPLGMVLVHSITGKEDKKKELKGWETSDMRLFLKLLVDIVSTSEVDEHFAEIVVNAWRELRDALDKKKLVFDSDGEDVWISKDFLDNLVASDGDVNAYEILKNVLRYVFNTSSPGSIEIIVPKQSSDKEIVLKIKSTDKPFALIRVGSNAVSDLKKWLVEEMGYMEGVDVVERSYFESLDEKPEISLLLGSRAFYEGWDSSRPNIIMFIGIGTRKTRKRKNGEEGSRDRRKFILQAVGRGVRIEPVKNKRKRRYFLCKEEGTLDVCKLGKRDVFPIETLFVWGSSAEVISDVIESMEKQKKDEGYVLDFVKENVREEDRKFLFVPVYSLKRVLIPEKPKIKFKMRENEYREIRRLVKRGLIGRDFLLFHFFGESRGVSPDRAVDLFMKVFSDDKERGKWITFVSGLQSTPRDVVRVIDEFFNHVVKISKVHSMEVDLESVTGKIVHFRDIRVRVKDRREIEKIRKKYEEMEKNTDRRYLNKLEKEIEELFKQGRRSDALEKVKELAKLEEEAASFEVYVDGGDEKKVKIIIRRDLLKHYYIPIVMEDSEKPQLLKNAISYKSEVKFIEDLGENIGKLDEISDDWKFSKIVERVDDIYIPYFEEEGSTVRKYYPDFIFWFKKGDKILVVLVDPKGTEHTSADRKIDGYEALFVKDEKPIVFYKDGKEIIFLLYFYSGESIHSASSGKYEEYWVPSVSELIGKIKNWL